MFSIPARSTVDNFLQIEGITLVAQKTKEKSEEKKRILVVDDDVGILRVFKSILEREGYVVETAETGMDALEKINNEKFDVCLVDVRLPDMDGTDILLNMVNDTKTIKIVVTGFSTGEVGKRAADYGADDFLVKPVKPEELIATVHDCLIIREQES
jgi:two-component system NtrC family response regulator